MIKYNLSEEEIRDIEYALENSHDTNICPFEVNPDDCASMCDKVFPDLKEKYQGEFCPMNILYRDDPERERIITWLEDIKRKGYIEGATKYLTIDYHEYADLVDQLVSIIRARKLFKGIEYIVGIPRGGLPLAVHLSHNLDIAMSKSLMNALMSNKKTLIVDDIADSGKTFKDILRNPIIKKATESRIITASLFYKPHSTFKPDIFVQETEDWVVFPWEKQIII